MYYRLKDDILFRKYTGYGYLTDNSEYGYRMLNDDRPSLGEIYVSDVGSNMLSTLDRVPRPIEHIVADLSQIYKDVETGVLHQDAVDFFEWFAANGYLSIGIDPESCINDGDSRRDAALVDEGAPPEMKTCANGLIQPEDLLRSIHIEVAGACNERCVHCYIPDKAKKELITPELMYRVLMEGRELNIIHVTMSGGEPMLHPELPRFLARCRDLDLAVSVLTNLTLLTDALVEEFTQNPLLSVQTSLYSMNPRTHDAITTVEGSFERTMRGIQRLLAAGIPLQISCPVMTQNQNSFMDVVYWGHDHAVAVTVEPVIFASYDHFGENLVNRLSAREVEQALEQTLTVEGARAIREDAAYKETLSAEDSICSVGRYSFGIAVNGDVFPCAGWQTNVLGNANEQPLREIWTGSSKLDALRGIKRKHFPQCVVCEDRGYCTVCMMYNANESSNNDPFQINDLRCRVASAIHAKVESILRGH